jgi:hypothetical protein
MNVETRRAGTFGSEWRMADEWRMSNVEWAHCDVIVPAVSALGRH